MDARGSLFFVDMDSSLFDAYSRNKLFPVFCLIQDFGFSSQQPRTIYPFSDSGTKIFSLSAVGDRAPNGEQSTNRTLARVWCKSYTRPRPAWRVHAGHVIL